MMCEFGTAARDAAVPVGTTVVSASAEFVFASWPYRERSLVWSNPVGNGVGFMVMSDPIADMLTRIRNALMRKHATVSIPSSKLKVSIAKILNLA